jgi:dephospho-CoA kinase
MTESSRLLVALTGGIASGKDATADCFNRRAVPVFDADAIARELVQPGAPAFAEIVAVFGAQMLTTSGELDRSRMRERIFADAQARRRLESILHPRVRAALLAAVQNCTAPYCVLVIPLLAEVRADYDFVDRVLVVDVSPEIQAQRLMLRDRCTPEAAAAMIAAQAPRSARLAIADDVVDNDGDQSFLGPAAERLHAIYTRLSARPVATGA